MAASNAFGERALEDRRKVLNMLHIFSMGFKSSE